MEVKAAVYSQALGQLIRGRLPGSKCSEKVAKEIAEEAAEITKEALQVYADKIAAWEPKAAEKTAEAKPA